MITRIQLLLKTHKQLRYIISGMISEILEYISFAGLLALTDLLILSNSVGFIVGIASGFVLHKLWSFAGEQQFKTHQQLVAYAILATVNFLLSNILISVCVDTLGIAPLIAKPITMVLIAGWSFIAFNFVIFKQRD